jgi:serine/threonine-protein kinase
VDQQRRYRLGQIVARGGFGTVYEAVLINPDGFTRPVAIKVLNDTGTAVQEYAQRLRDEARMLGLIRHRSVVEVHGLIRLRGSWAVAMEYVEGVDLSQIIAVGPVPPTVAVSIVGEVAAALYVAYTTAGPTGTPIRLLHRDIKPGNIRLTPEGHVKILDFGAGRAEFEGREAKTKAITFGSMSYMAPERLDGFDSHAADIYSLGVVMFEMLTANALGRSSAAPSRFEARLREVMDHLWQMTGGVSEELVRFTGVMLAYDPNKRPDGREVERHCASLSRTLEGPLLRDWAEKAVTAGLAYAPQREDGPLTGLEFSDSGLEIPAALRQDPKAAPAVEKRSDGLTRASFGTGSVTIPPPELSHLFENPPPETKSSASPLPNKAPRQLRLAEEPEGPSPRTRILGLGALILLVLGAGTTIALLVLSGQGVPAIQQAPPSRLQSPGASELPSSAASESPANDATSGQTAKGTPTHPRSESPTLAEGPTGRVEISGFAEEVWLVNDGGRRRPGELATGRYRIQARFTVNGPMETVGTVDVQPNITTHLNCSKVYKTCSARD